MSGLHRRFHHEIEFRDGQNILIVTGPNGYGKTAFVELLAAILQLDMQPIVAHNFSSFEIVFSDGSILAVGKKSNPKQSSPVESVRESAEIDVSETGLTLNLSRPGKGLLISKMGRSESAGPLSQNVQRMLPFVQKIDFEHFYDTRTGEVLNRRRMREMLQEYPEPSRNSRQQFDEIRKFLSETRCLLIGAQRTIALRKQGVGPEGRSYELGIEERSKSITAKIKEAVAKYAAFSQQLDSSFPLRVVRRVNEMGANPPARSTQEDLERIEFRRRSFIDAGLVTSSAVDLSLTDSQITNDVMRSVLEVYIQDTNRKLDSVQQIKDQIELFVETINRKFSFKSLAIGADAKIKIVSKEGGALKIADLSSGEQHQFILLYDMIFESQKNMMMIVDEPEISLHVSWQKSFLPDLMRISKLNDYQAIVATHSPQIIGSRWEIVSEFGPIDD